MNYLPVHPNMAKSLRNGMKLISNHKASQSSFGVVRLCQGSVCLIAMADGLRYSFATTPGTAKAITDFYISVEDIRSMRPFNGKQYIEKYQDFAIPAACLHLHQQTHAEVKARVEAKKEPNVYLPIHPDMWVKLKPGAFIIHNGGGTRQGWEGKIIAIDYHAEYDAVLVKYNNSVDQYYSKSWFLKNIHIEVGSIKMMQSAASYLIAHQEDQKDSSAYTIGKQPDLESLQLHRKEPIVTQAHQFNVPAAPTKWLAIAKAEQGALGLLEADSEPGIKAKIALAVAEDPSLQFDVFAKVGHAEVEKTLKFS